jgi:membrane peptidoglycan carboxypeptidase
MSRNLGTIRVGERIGFGTVANLWKARGRPASRRTATRRSRSACFELTPLEVAQAYTLFLNEGNVRPLRSIARIQADKTVRARRPKASGVGGQPAIGRSSSPT